MKGKRKKNDQALKGPEKFIKQYLNQHKSYKHYRLKVYPFLFRIDTTRRLKSIPIEVTLVLEEC